MQVIKISVVVVLGFMLQQSSCYGQNRPAKDASIMRKAEVVKRNDVEWVYFEKHYKLTREQLYEYNPKLAAQDKEYVHKGDTVYLSKAVDPITSPPQADPQGTLQQPQGTPQQPQKKEDVNSSVIEKLLGKSGLFRQITFNGKTYYVYEIDPHKYKVELFNSLDNERNEPYSFNSIANIKKKDLLFAMNGGMYEQDLTPVGLFISGGKTYNPINLQTDGKGNFYDLLPNGVFSLDNNDTPSILPSPVYNKQNIKSKLATQSGPLLLINGVYNSNFKLGSTNIYIRNGVGVNKKGNVIFVISAMPVNFYDFAQFYKDHLKCDNALYLDGAVSEIYVPELDGPHSAQSHQLGVFITVSRKTANDNTQEPDKTKSETPIKTPKGKPAKESKANQ